MATMHSHISVQAHDFTQHGASDTQSLTSRAEQFRARFPQRYRKATAADAANVAESVADDPVTEIDAPEAAPKAIGRVIRLAELLRLVGLSRSSIYDRSSPKSPRFDSSFPRRLHLGARTVGWLEAEVLAWIESRAVARPDS